MIQNERRLNRRKPPDQLAYISLPADNGGIVLDLSEGGLCFHSVAPIQADGPIQFRFSVNSSARIEAVGELAWKDSTGRTGGLRFIELPLEIRNHLRDWSGPPNARAADILVAEQQPEPLVSSQEAATAVALAPAAATVQVMDPVPVPMVEPAFELAAQLVSSTEVVASNTFDLAPFVINIQVLEQALVPSPLPAIHTEVAPAGDVELTPVASAVTAAEPAPAPVLEAAPAIRVNSVRPPASQTLPSVKLRVQPYAAPFNSMSMFPHGSIPAARANFAPRQPFPSRHPITALLLTVVLASIIGTGIFALVSTSQTGEALIYYGQQAWKSLHTHSASVSPK